MVRERGIMGVGTAAMGVAGATATLASADFLGRGIVSAN